nr:very short patch repair endonuclease [Ruegeria atlantica]
MMSQIRNRDTKPELAVRKALHRRGFRYRVNVRSLPGTPDIVFPKWGAVLFVHGCFWHRHPGCQKATYPSSNTEFWEQKFRQNIERDERNLQALLSIEWRVGILWECVVGKFPSEELSNSLESFLTGGQPKVQTFE